jgi:5-oxoprolinase (ATP-hydrolysing) subunit A
MPVNSGYKNTFLKNKMLLINCDMGEGLDNDESLMPYIDSANIACGYHAGDTDTIKKTIALAQKNKVQIGAHFSYADKENFGRKEMFLSNEVVYDMVSEQLLQFSSIAKEMGEIIIHVKPHGALYNQAAKNIELATAIATAVFDQLPTALYFGLSGSMMLEAARNQKLTIAHEVFADRAYLNDGSLCPRNISGSVFTNEKSVAEQVSLLMQEKKIRAMDGTIIDVAADTICIHADTPNALAFAKVIFSIVKNK